MGDRTESFDVAFNVRSAQRLAEVVAGDVLHLPVTLVPEFSPEALAIMELGSQRDIDIAAKMYRWPAFGDETVGPPQRCYMREIDMGNDRDLFDEDPTGVPLYEGRMVDQFDHRAKGYRRGRGRAADWEDLPFDTLDKSIQPQWHIAAVTIPEKCRERVHRYRVGFCDVASPTNERTLVTAIIPPNTICGHKVPTIVCIEDGFEWYLTFWLAVANSYSTDFLARKKVNLSMTYTVLDSLPFPRPTADDPRVRRLVPLCLQLTCTGPEMVPFWNQMAVEGGVSRADEASIPGVIDDEERLRLRAEIDAIVACEFFNLTRDEIDYIHPPRHAAAGPDPASPSCGTIKH